MGAASTVLIERVWINYRPRPDVYCPISTGSGAHLGGGVILTAAHVLWEPKVGDPCLPTIPNLPFGDDRNTNVSIFARGAIINVRDASGATNTARLVWLDAFTDLAILRAPNLDRTPALAWGDSRAMRVGEPVIAVGYPITGATVTRGIVSALRTVPSPVVGNSVMIDLIQTDAAINPGNSGGPLLNERGQLVGIVDFRVEGGNYGLNFAIAESTARRVVEQRISGP